MADIFDDIDLERLREKRIAAEIQKETPITERTANLFDAGSLIGTYGKDAAGLLRSLGIDLTRKRANVPEAEAESIKEETKFKSARKKDRRSERKEDRESALMDVKAEVQKKELRKAEKTPAFNAAAQLVKTLQNRLNQIRKIEVKKGEFLTGDEATIKEQAEARVSEASNLLSQFQPKTQNELALFKEQLRRLEAARTASGKR